MIPIPMHDWWHFCQVRAFVGNERTLRRWRGILRAHLAFVRNVVRPNPSPGIKVAAPWKMRVSELYPNLWDKVDTGPATGIKTNCLCTPVLPLTVLIPISNTMLIYFDVECWGAEVAADNRHLWKPRHEFVVCHVIPSIHGIFQNREQCTFVCECDRFIRFAHC